MRWRVLGMENREDLDQERANEPASGSIKRSTQEWPSNSTTSSPICLFVGCSLSVPTPQFSHWSERDAKVHRFRVVGVMDLKRASKSTASTTSAPTPHQWRIRLHHSKNQFLAFLSRTSPGSQISDPAHTNLCCFVFVASSPFLLPSYSQWLQTL